MFGQPVRMLPVGFYISETKTPGRIYAMSLEHHVRTEARFHNVANWKIYAFQFEEEGREGLIVIWQKCPIVKISNGKCVDVSRYPCLYAKED